ncbi:MAG: Histone H1-like protein Hc1 [Chlamydiia bacterium]|nr:Histone H1-like protein Hc1 [Chlamydiia bacterium]
METITTITGDGSMALKDTTSQLNELLENVAQDLEKGTRGNKAASQRVRTGTIRLEKLAKLYRKQSILNEKRKSTAKKAAPKKAAVKKATKKPVKKAAAKKTKGRR